MASDSADGGRRSLRVLVAVVSVGLLSLGAGCGSTQEISADRADVKAAPPPSGSVAASPTRKARHTAKARAPRPVATRTPRTAPVARVVLPAGSATDATVPTSRWVSLRDAPTDIGFRLPAAVRHTNIATPLQRGGRLVTRVYQVQNLDSDLEIVSFAAMPPGASLYNRDASIPNLKRGLEISGADVTLVGDHPLTVDGHPARDLTFLLSGAADAGVDEIRLVLTSDTLITAQTFIPGRTDVRSASAAHRTLIGSLRL